jgi:hypothetical protein
MLGSMKAIPTIHCFKPANRNYPSRAANGNISSTISAFHIVQMFGVML